MRFISSFRFAIVGCALALGVAIPRWASSQQFAGQQFAGHYPNIAPATPPAASAGPGYYAAAMRGAALPPTTYNAPPSMPSTYPAASPAARSYAAAPQRALQQAPAGGRPTTAPIQKPAAPPNSASPLAGLKSSLGLFPSSAPQTAAPSPQPTLSPRQAAWAGGANAGPNSAPPIGSFPTHPVAYNAPVSPYTNYAAEVAARAGTRPAAHTVPSPAITPPTGPTAYTAAPYAAASSAALQVPMTAGGARLTAPTASAAAGYGAAYLQANAQPTPAPSIATESLPTFPVAGAGGFAPNSQGLVAGSPSIVAPPGGVGPYAAPPLGGGFVGPNPAMPSPNYGGIAPGGPTSSIWQQPAMPDPISSGGYGAANYGPPAGGGCDPQVYDPGVSYFDPGVPSCGPWFASVSGLIMTRDVPNNVPLAYIGADPHGPSTLNTEQAGFDWSGGVEAKLGRMVSDRWAMEVVYWWLDPSNGYLSQRSLANDINSHLDMSNVLYDGFPLSNIYENSREQRVFRMNQFQNLEINLLQQALVVDPQSRWGMAYFMGARYFKYREILEYYAVQANSEFSDNDMTTQSGYHIRMRNSLIGWQVGARGHLYLGERLRLFATPRAGIFANAISMDQDLCMVIRLNNTKTDVTLLGQLDFGASYQLFRCCSIFGSYRVMGIAGVANADDQIPRSFDSLPDLAQINSSGSIILHGWNMGVQFQF